MEPSEFKFSLAVPSNMPACQYLIINKISLGSAHLSYNKLHNYVCSLIIYHIRIHICVILCYRAHLENEKSKLPSVKPSTSEDFGKRILGYSNSTIAIRKTVSQMWHLMRKSFINQVKGENSSFALKKSASSKPKDPELHKALM